MDDKWKINLSMADATYPVWIKPEDEEIVRKVAQQVNDILKEYREKWPNVEKERIVTMIAYRFSLESLLEKQRNDTTPYTEKITELTKTLEEHFKKE